MRKTLLFAVAVLCTAAVAAPALAGPGGTNRPFQSAATGVTSVTPTGPGTFASSSAGTMVATHLGKGAYTISATQNWAGASWPLNPCAATSGTFTFVAANGATITGALAGTTCELAPFDNTKYATSLTGTITGGSGRFGSASGTFAITGTSTATTTPGLFTDASTSTGTISY